MCYITFVSFLVEKFDEVADSVCVGQSTGSDERVVLFLKMADGYRYDSILKSHLVILLWLDSLQS